MTGLQKFLIIAAFTAAAGFWGYKAQQLSTLRHRVEILQQELENERSNVSASAVAAPQPELAQVIPLQPDDTELLRLRHEAAQLRSQIAALKAEQLNANWWSSGQGSVPPKGRNGQMRRLGLAASKGDMDALRKLQELVLLATERNKAEKASSKVSGSDTHREVRLAFKVMGEEAGKGSESALEALRNVGRIKDLDGMTIYALGDAAAMGNEKALEMLLDLQKHLGSTLPPTWALLPAAKNGKTGAIEYLAALVNKPGHEGEWGVVAMGLMDPAAAGNTTAIDALTVIARSGPEWLRSKATRALENAAFNNNHAKAIETLRSLSYKSN